ncbi:MAG: aldehyde dehydrogenase family protein [Colwellia sp.]|nr:aldehyde dehydrogenase family protein [Colwellia sp.]MCW8863728.1 aldehyde dehydrogenase family protein [Colwellia sp.]MCW9081367.1 aldehyde dehydrogenase family protein [Colwellia sp.]
MFTNAEHWINGRWFSTEDRLESINPATGETLGYVTVGGLPEAESAVEIARQVFEQSDWSRNRERRVSALHSFADNLEARKDELIRTLSAENGKLIAEATGEVMAAIAKVRYNASLASVDCGRAAEVGHGVYSMSIREAIGVAGIIVPWNAPVILLIRSLAPALAAGCTAVIKVAQQTALTSRIVIECLAKVEGLPQGGVNVFIEAGSAGAEYLVETEKVDVISYTGSSGVGKRIMASGANTLKRMNLELGGKSPSIVFDDANLDTTLPALVAAGTRFAGQFCMSGSRILVQRSCYEEVKRKLVTIMNSLVIGPGDDPLSQMGPLIDHDNCNRVLNIIQNSASEGELLVEGKRLEGELANGCFVSPSLIAVNNENSKIVQEEVFGPFMTLECFDEEADAVSLANCTSFGLGASLWTENASRTLRVARELRVGTVWINDHGMTVDQFEEGGYKESGIGRLNGVGGIEAFLETKHIFHPAGSLKG